MKTGLKLLAVLLFAIFSFNGAVFADEAPKLAGYQADLSQTSVSGLSSGAFMPAQFHVAYSDLLTGAGKDYGKKPRSLLRKTKLLM